MARVWGAQTGHSCPLKTGSKVTVLRRALRTPIMRIHSHASFSFPRDCASLLLRTQTFSLLLSTCVVPPLSLPPDCELLEASLTRPCDPGLRMKLAHMGSQYVLNGEAEPNREALC